MLKCQARIDDTASRYREMLDEVRENHKFKSLVRIWLELGADDPISSLLSAFMSGLIVGCEMTKETK